MTTVAIVDDHHSVRAGLETVIGEAAGLVVVGSAAGELDLMALLRRTRPDVVVMDYHLPGADGLILCRRTKRDRPPVPAVLIYSAYAAQELAIPAYLAGADGVVHKGAPATELVQAIRSVAAGVPVLPRVTGLLLTEVAERLDPSDRPIIPMMLDGAREREIAGTLGISPRELEERVEGIIGRLRVAVPGSAQVH